ncbi:MAG: hypothetical protein JSR62_18360 [Nitrospira sp.]|nr:hypothetical protein [Nitrospira sp.]
MTRLARILVAVGLLLASVAALWLGGRERSAQQAESPVSPGSPRVGRSTLSHGGPATGPLPEQSGRPSASRRDVGADSSSDATTR